jgi:hypothetical protein
MDADIMCIKNPLESLIQSETHNPSADTKIYFNDLHLSPLKVIIRSIERSIM